MALVVEPCCTDWGNVGEFLQSFAADILGEDSVDVAVAEVFLDFFQFWSGFCFVTHTKYDTQDLAVLE